MSLDRARLQRAKKAFTTRRVPVEDMRHLLAGSPASGDLVLARVEQIGKHKRVELTNGRRATLFEGDEIVVCYGNRYAPDQFEALVPDNLEGCDLVAAGGVAAREVSRHERMSDPTRITPIGLIGKASGKRLNLADYALPAERPSRSRAAKSNADAISVVLVAGTSMNAGKTLTAASLVRGFRSQGEKVAAIKVTGTGAGGDVWIMEDVGADLVLDFTDAGYASTYKTPVREIERASFRLIQHAENAGCTVAVIEIADGVQQFETAALLRSKRLRDITSGVVFAAYDSMGAKSGVETLKASGHRVVAVSGRLARSQLMIREALQSTGLPVFTPRELMQGAAGRLLAGTMDQAEASSGTRDQAPKTPDQAEYLYAIEDDLEFEPYEEEFDAYPDSGSGKA